MRYCQVSMEGGVFDTIVIEEQEGRLAWEIAEELQVSMGSPSDDDALEVLDPFAQPNPIVGIGYVNYLYESKIRQLLRQETKLAMIHAGKDKYTERVETLESDLEQFHEECDEILESYKPAKPAATSAFYRIELLGSPSVDYVVVEASSAGEAARLAVGSTGIVSLGARKFGSPELVEGNPLLEPGLIFTTAYFGVGS